MNIEDCIICEINIPHIHGLIHRKDHLSLGKHLIDAADLGWKEVLQHPGRSAWGRSGCQQGCTPGPGSGMQGRRTQPGVTAAAEEHQRTSGVS